MVLLMVIETWVLHTLVSLLLGGEAGNRSTHSSVTRIMRLGRLTRMFRMAKLLRWMPELVILLKGVGRASRSVFFTLVLLVMVVYVFAIAFKQLSFESPVIGPKYFASVGMSMATLLFRAVLPDVATLVYECAEEDYFYAAVMVMFILAASLTVMNMLVGVLVEVVATVSAVENEAMMVNMIRSNMHEIITNSGLDVDGDGQISKDEFEALLVCPQAAQFIQDIGVDVVGLCDYSDVIFRERDLEFTEFIELILQLRGNNPSKVKDIVDLRKVFMKEIEKISDIIEFSSQITSQSSHGDFNETANVFKPEPAAIETTRLAIHIVSARGFFDTRSRETKTSSCLHCECAIAGKPFAVSRTNNAEDKPEVSWNHEGSVSDFMPGDALQFRIFKFDGFEDKVLGQVMVPSAQFCVNGFDGTLWFRTVEKRDANLTVKIMPSRVKHLVVPVPGKRATLQVPSAGGPKLLSLNDVA